MEYQKAQGNTEAPKEGGTQKNEASSQSIPTISLPKGGGAIRGMGEKLAANPGTGTGSMSVPIATSPGRSGFGSKLSISYDSGAGNGPFGFGWNLSIPSITRKTDKGLPKYHDADESDTFILSGAEDLVPILSDLGGGKWKREELDPRNIDGKTYLSAAIAPASKDYSPVSSVGQIRPMQQIPSGAPSPRTISRLGTAKPLKAKLPILWILPVFFPG